jgi:hypothetical protein
MVVQVKIFADRYEDFFTFISDCPFIYQEKGFTKMTIVTMNLPAHTYQQLGPS